MPKTNYIKLFVCFNFYGKIMGGQTFNKYYKTGDKAWIEKYYFQIWKELLQIMTKKIHLKHKSH